LELFRKYRQNPRMCTYIFDGDDTLIWDEISQAITFECDGGKILFKNGGKL